MRLRDQAAVRKCLNHALKCPPRVLPLLVKHQNLALVEYLLIPADFVSRRGARSQEGRGQDSDDRQA